MQCMGIALHAGAAHLLHGQAHQLPLGLVTFIASAPLLLQRSGSAPFLISSVAPRSVHSPATAALHSQ